MKTLAGVLAASGGASSSAARRSRGSRPRERVLAGIVLVPEGRLVFPDLSVHENLRLGAVNRRARAGWRAALDEVHAIFPSCSSGRHQAAATLSGGEQQMLAIGRGLMARPSLMLLDEPTLGCAAGGAAHVRADPHPLRVDHPARRRAGRPAHARRRAARPT
jgi:branched-chain amino acid transport system ATP-binding protein